MIQRYILVQLDKYLCIDKSRNEYLKSIIKTFSSKITLNDFDDSYLRPSPFLELCKELKFNPAQLYDKYYSFIFSDYSKILKQYRVNHHLNQKQLSKLICISPIDIGLFEKGMKHPTRVQYKKIVKVLKNDAL